MLKELRIRLTILCTVFTSLILFVICLLALQISEKQLEERNQLAFETQMQTIIYQLQSHQSIKYSWLATMESDYSSIISILDTGTPLLFKGSWTPLTDRNLLIQKAREKALLDYGFDIRVPPSSSLTPEKVFFKMKGDTNDFYRVGLVSIPSTRGFFNLTLLQDTSSEKTVIIRTRFLFFFVSLIGITFLALFSFWFTGRALVPIESNRKKQVAFIAAASHELKTPLAVIRSSNAVIESGEGDSLTFTNQIEKECTRMARLVDDLLLLATADANTWSIHKAPIEVDTLLIDMLDTFLPLAWLKKQRLSLQLRDEPLEPLICDSERIQQVVTILLDNALYYVQEKGTITLQLYALQNHLILKVIDNGPGISKEHRIHIFDRFYRVDCSRKDKEHYGLGLSIAQEIVHLHQGHIDLTETPGGGCTFTISLPYC